MSINLIPRFCISPIQVHKLAWVCKSWKVYTCSVHSLGGSGALLGFASSSSSSCGKSAGRSGINSAGAGTASEFLTNGSSICLTRLWVFAASSCTLSETGGNGGVMLVDKGGGEDMVGAEECKGVDAGNIYGGIYITGYVWSVVVVVARRVVEGSSEVSG